MTDAYRFDPKAWHPALAGAVAGSIAAIVAAIVSLPLRSPNENIANSVSVVIVSIALGVLSGMLWRRLRAGSNPSKMFAWTLVGGFVAAMLAVTLGDRLVLDNLISYVAPLAAIVFVTLGFLVPVLSKTVLPVWVAAIPIILALAVGLGLFGRGNIASGDLSLDDLAVDTTTATSTATETPTDTTLGSVETLSGELALPGDLSDSFTVSSGIATYSVPEILQGLSTQGVGESSGVTGSIVPGGEFTFTLDMLSFVSDQSRRDSKVRGWFTQFPEATFSGESFALSPTAVVGEVQTFEVIGDLTVNGIARSTAWTIQARVEADGSLSIQGETDIVLSEFNIEIVDSGTVTMADAGHLEVLVSATPSG
jgi:hypothetical protein